MEQAKNQQGLSARHMCDTECPTFSVQHLLVVVVCLGAVLFYINMKLFLTSKIWKEGKHYIAYNPELEVASQGKTVEVAEKMLKEAVSLFIETAKKIGTFNKILREDYFKFLQN